MSRELRGQLPGGMVHGFPGKSAYEIAVEQGFTGDIFEWLESLKGPDGISPHIGENENWFVGDIDTGNPSRGRVGPEGEPGFSPTVSMEAVSEGTRITVTDAEGEKTTVIHNGKQGESGYTPVKGTDYFDGITPHIGENGNWWIDETDTGLPSRGESIRGDTGKSAYEAAVEGGFSGTEAEFEAKMANTPTVQISMNTITQKASHSSGEILELVNGGLNVEASDSLSGNLFHLVRAAATKSVFERFRYTSDGKWLLETLEVDSNKTITVTNKYIEGLLPSGGTAGQLLKKVINGCQWADAPVGVPMSVGEVDQVLVKTGSGPSWCDRLPRGGIAGQILKKTEYGETWSDEVKELPDDGSAGQILESTGNGVRWTNLPSGLPDGGTPGQLLGKTENGEAWVDPPEGGTGTSVQPDWNQNDDTQADYVKNRPFYSTIAMATLVDNVTTDEDGAFVVPSLLVVGKEYQTTINGETFTGTAKAATMEGQNVVFLGNSAAFGQEDTDETYCVVTMDVGGGLAGVAIYLGGDGTAVPPYTVTISGNVEEIVKVPSKFLPDSVTVHRLTRSQTGVYDADSFITAMADLMTGKALVYLDGMQVCHVVNRGTNSDGKPYYSVRLSRYPLQNLHYNYQSGADGYVSYDYPYEGTLALSRADILGSDAAIFGYMEIFVGDTSSTITTTYTLDGSNKKCTFYPLPDFTAADNGKVLGVVDGALAWVAK